MYLHAFFAQQSTHAVRTEGHSHDQEQQQGRDTIFVSDLIGKDADEEQQRQYQQNEFDVHIFNL